MVAFDHPGVGESDAVVDPFAITPSLVARCHDRAVREVRNRVESGTLAPDVEPVAHPFVVGLGHSMGGLIAIAQQGLFRSFDALVVFGHSGFGLPEVLTAAELEVTAARHDLLEIEEQIEQLARARFTQPSDVPRKQPARGTFFADDVPPAVRRAFEGQAVPLLPTCGLASMMPHSAGHQAASVDVPVFLCLGDEDLAVDRYGAIGLYRSSPDATVYLLEASGHCHNQASSRAQLWERTVGWIDEIAV